MYNSNTKNKALRLRIKGKTYPEIQKEMSMSIPKSTLSEWCKGIDLPNGYKKNFVEYNLKTLEKARVKSLEVRKILREKYFSKIFERNEHLQSFLFKSKETCKISLAVLYLAEGSKKETGILTFGNSNEFIIKLFMFLLRTSYKVNESKFRCTVQCRADQNIKELEKYWSNVTKISPKQFYKAQVDPRTRGKATKKVDYKGVCRVNYMSADIFWELQKISEILYKGL